MPAVDLWRDCPGFAEAARRESEIRDVPFLGLPESVGGVQCAPLTLRRVLWLSLAKSPFLLEIPIETLAEKPGLAADIYQFLWIVSPEFSPGNTHAQNRFNRRIKPALKHEGILSEIRSYLDESWMDAGEEGERTRSFYSAAASITSFFHRNYCLPVDVWENSWWRNLIRRATGQPNPLDIPLKIAWQLMRAHSTSQNGDVKFANKLSDKPMREWLANLNAGN